MCNPRISYKNPAFSDIENMRRLWKITCNDTDDYLNIIFSNYINLDSCIVAYSDTELIAMLIGIPYKFVVNKHYITGLYLCGLSTLKPYRGQGIMSNMLDMIKVISRKYSYDFTFLIPADSHLRNYYSKLGYYNSSHINKYAITHTSLFTQETIADRYKIWEEYLSYGHRITVEVGEMEVAVYGREMITDCVIMDLANSLHLCEASTPGNHIIHTSIDWYLILEEKLLSGYLLFFSSDFSLVFMMNIDGEIELLRGEIPLVSELLCVVFSEVSCDDNSSMDVNFRDHDDSNILIDETVELYGMVRFEKEYSNNFLEKFKGSENRIFERECGVVNKYGKINSHENDGELNSRIASTIRFRYMLD